MQSGPVGAAAGRGQSHQANNPALGRAVIARGGPNDLFRTTKAKEDTTACTSIVHVILTCIRILYICMFALLQ